MIGVGSPLFHCVRCGEPYDPRTHPIHAADNAQPPILARLAELPRRRDALAGLYGWDCPTCGAGPGMWCVGATRDGPQNLLDMHERRRKLAP